MGRIYVILGKGASGKTRMAKDLSKIFGLKQVISYTTRPPREGEINGLDYHFVTHEQYKQLDLVCKEQYIVKPNGFCGYGVNVTDLKTDEDIVIVLTPSGYRELKEKFGDSVEGIYIMSSNKTRFERYCERDPKDPKVRIEAERRIDADEEDFYEFEFEVEEIVRNEGKYEEAFESVEDIFMFKHFII